MTRYLFSPPVEPAPSGERQSRWQTFAAFVTFAALVALAGATYGSLRRGDVYSEVQKHQSLQRFAGVLESSALTAELKDKSRSFTLIAPSDTAFDQSRLVFASEDRDNPAEDSHVVRIKGEEPSYLLQGEAYVLPYVIRPREVPGGNGVYLTTVNGEGLMLARSGDSKQQVTVNGVPVRDQLAADNGIIYIVDQLVYPLPDTSTAQMR